MSAGANHKDAPLRRLPLHDLHLELGATIAPFAGYEMPVNYALGVLKEHLHTRAAAGLFDVSHMGQIAVRPRSGRIEDAARALELLIPADVLGLAPFRLRYGFLTNANGGIVDDLMIAHCGDHFMLVVNAGRKAADEVLVRERLSEVCTIETLEDRCLLSLQGPGAESTLAQMGSAAASMRFMDVRAVSLAGASCIVSRSGYTGEDGFEISVQVGNAERLARALLQDPAVRPIGLGARDSLRTEAGLCLHGSDIDESTTPVEAALEWAIPPVRRRGGARAGHFPGDTVILDQLGHGAVRRRAGLKPQGRAPVRGGALLYGDSAAGQPIGKVTSGGFSPSLAAPIAMGYLPSSVAAENPPLFAEVRGNRIPIAIAPLPFVAHRYKRK